MGCVPARGGNGNSHNVSCLKPSLHLQGAPLGRGATLMVDQLKSAFTSYLDIKGTQKIG